MLGKIIHRDHPIATGFGSYPSGGVGRLVSIYGVILLLVDHAASDAQPRLATGLWTGLSPPASSSPYTRIYLSKHWTTDSVFGLVLGTWLLLVNVAAVTALPGRRRRRRRQLPPVESEQSRPGQPLTGATDRRLGDAQLTAGFSKTVSMQPAARLDTVRRRHGRGLSAIARPRRRLVGGGRVDAAAAGYRRIDLTGRHAGQAAPSSPDPPTCGPTSTRPPRLPSWLR